MLTGKKPKPAIRDINDLSGIFIQALKEFSKSRKRLTLDAFSRKLAGYEELNNLIELASCAVDDRAYPVLKEENEQLKTTLNDKETERKNLLNQLAVLEKLIDREKDFSKRITLTLLSLNQNLGDKRLSDILNTYKQLVMDEADLDSREELLSNIKNRILKLDVTEEKGEESDRKRMLIKSLLKRPKDDPLKHLKTVSVKALTELRAIIGDEFNSELSLIEHRIRESDTLEYLLSQRTAILSVIGLYTDRIQSEKEMVTAFIKEIGDKLVALEQNLYESSSTVSSIHKDNLSFNENLENEISRVSEKVQKSDRIKELKSFIISRLENITTALSKKHEEYIIQIENAEKDDEKIREHFKHMITRLQDQNKILEEKSRKDPLTGISNRLVFEEHIIAEFERFQRYKAPFSLLFLDIDHFKNVNDRYGHEAGDRALKGIARSSREVLRKTDMFARYGGEEFVAILLETGLKRGVEVAEKLRTLIEHAEFEYRGNKVPITISIGITEARESDSTPESIVNRADKLLYRAKEMGRNKVISDLDMEDSAVEH